MPFLRSVRDSLTVCGDSVWTDGFILHPSAFILAVRGRNSMVECQLPKLKVAGSIPVARSIFLDQLEDSASSTFNGLMLALDRRMSNESELLAFMTLRV